MGLLANWEKVTGCCEVSFLRRCDYQQNVRMILSEEGKVVLNTCTMETANGRAAYEDPIFGQTGVANEVEATRIATPSAWTGNTSAFVSHLGRLSGHTLGPNSLQKVMAGDQVTAFVSYYYAANSASTNPNIVTNLVTNMLSLISGHAAGTLVSEGGSNVTNQLSNNPNFITAVEPSNATSGTPQAYLTILFFDERFNLIPASNGGVYQAQVRATDAGNPNASLLELGHYPAPKNGYAYIYVSNRSDQDVFFDNFLILFGSGAIAEEDHYYPFGLKIAAISSHKIADVVEGKLSNPYLYNDKEMLDENTTLNWYDYGFRNYDPQIGRFPQLDPLTDGYPELTPFQFAGNDPIANVDEDGLEPANVLAFAKSVGAGLDAIRHITSGLDAGGWAVTVSNEFDSYVRVFRAAAPIFNRTLAIINFAVKGATMIDKLEVRPPTAGGLTPSQQATSDRIYEEDNSYPDRTKGLIHLPTKAQTENYPFRSAIRTAGFYIAKGTPVKAIDEAIAEWMDPDASGWDKVQRTAELFPAGATGEGGDEGTIGDGEGGEGFGTNSASPEIPLKYKAHIKHAEGRAWDGASEMDLSDIEAQDVLKKSMQIGDQRFGYKDGKLYNFMYDNAGTWHGYQVNTAPAIYLRSLRSQKIISNSQYNKFLKASDK